jgi:hypothetical protein
MSLRTCPFWGVALIVMALGCGGGSHRLSHDEFVRRANAICADYAKRTGALASQRTVADLISWSEKALPIAKQDVGKFKQLYPPKADEAGWKAYAREGDKVIVWLGKLRDEARRNDRAAIVMLKRYGQREAARETRISENLGLAECG